MKRTFVALALIAAAAMAFGQGTIKMAIKGVLGMFWFVIAYVLRLYIDLFIEPTTNPIKHFPVVTVAAKLIIPIIPAILSGVTSILPSLFPIFATGTVLWLGGEGLQFASIIAITVAFALAIDSTIHFLNRFQLEESRPGTTGVDDALIRTMHHIGPVIVLTTIVLALGLGVTILSHLPSLRLFGRLAGICLFASLIGQLIILPATVALFRRYFPRRLPASAA